jgi:D-lyxose ketol-isomerase
MKNIEIGGKKFTLRNGDEVTYGAQKEVEKVKFAASLAMMSNKDVTDMMADKTKGEDAEGITEENLMDRLAKGDIKKALINSQDAAVTIGEEAIMLSANITRDAIMDMPATLVKELAKAAEEELGGLLDFTKPLTIDTT